MSTDPDIYNGMQYDAGRLRDEHITALTKLAQTHLGLLIDGKCGPDTRLAVLQWAEAKTAPAPAAPQIAILDGWMQGPTAVIRMPIDKTWYGGTMYGGYPAAIVWHYTATGPGTAKNMANNRKEPFRKGVDRAASWHLTIDTDGSIIQMVPLTCKAWHAGSPTAKKIPGLGAWANDVAVSIELVSVNGASFTTAQVQSAKAVTRALARTYGIKREYAMVGHGELDPQRRSDPGPVWMTEHAKNVLDYAYAQ